MAGNESGKTCTVEVFRYNPETDSAPRFQSFQVPFHEEWGVVDALNYIKWELDGSLAYRYSCRMGVCGSCGMMVNGTPRLTCSSFLKDYYPSPIRIEPLAGFPVIRDLVIDLDSFLDKLESLKTWLIPKEEKTVDQGEFKQLPIQLAEYKQYTLCINCLCCYAACPVYVNDPHFLGPAAIALAQRYNMDSRDGAAKERLDMILSDPGAWECGVVEECSVVCPKHVDPASAIQKAKMQGAQDWWVGMIAPGGKR